MFKKKKLLITTIITIITISSIIYKDTKRNTYNIETIIKTTPSYVQSITTVTTNNKQLNSIITTYIENQKKIFEKKTKNQNNNYLIGKDELNIDYQLNILDKQTWNISLITTMSGPSFPNPYNDIKCLTWNFQKKKELNIENIIQNSTALSLITKQVYEKIKTKCNTCITDKTFKQLFNKDFKNFQITENIITFYFYNQPVSLEIKDLSLIKQQKKKKPNIKKSNTLKTIDPNKPVVALTFDDGPSKYTEEIINILKYYDVNASFFILGNKVTSYQQVLKTSIENGNELGNHSYNHKWLSRLSVNELIEQIEKTQKIIQENFNYTPQYLRPTYGSITNQIRKNTDLKIVLWTVDTRDWKYHDVNQIIKRATENIKDGDIILMHDIFKRTKDSLIKIIPILKEQGFQFVTVSELEEVKKIRKLEKETPQ